MNYLLYPIYTQSQLQFPPKSLNYVALLGLDLEGQEISIVQLILRLQAIFVHYTRLESLDLSHGYIHSVSEVSSKPSVVSRLRLADMRFESIQCFEQLLLQVTEPRVGLRNLWLNNVTVDLYEMPPLNENKVLTVTHLCCDSVVPAIFKLLHTRLFWLELTINQSLLHTFYASPTQVYSHKYPLFFNLDLDFGIAPTPTIHLLLEDKNNSRLLYSIPKPLAYMYICLLLISRSLGGKRLINISRRRARTFYSRIMECFKDDHEKLGLNLRNYSQVIADSSHEDMIYSPSLVISFLTYGLVMKKLIYYLKHSLLSSIEQHQITIEMDMLDTMDLVVLLPNFNKLLQFLRITQSSADVGAYKRRYSKEKLRMLPFDIIKLTFLLPSKSRMIVLSYSSASVDTVTVVETPLVLHLRYIDLLESECFKRVFEDIRKNHDCMNIQEHLGEFYQTVHRTHFCSTMSSFSSTSRDLIPCLSNSSHISMDARTQPDKDKVKNESSTESDTSFTNYRNLLCIDSCQICSAVRAKAKKTSDPDRFIQNIFSQPNSPFKCPKVIQKSIRKLLKVQTRAFPTFSTSATDITYISTSQEKRPMKKPTQNEYTYNSHHDQDNKSTTSSNSFIDEGEDDDEDEEDSSADLSPRQSIGRLVRRTLGDVAVKDDDITIDNSDHDSCMTQDLSNKGKLFGNNRFFRFLGEYIENANIFLIYNGYILSTSYETLRKVYLLLLKKSLIYKHPILKRLSAPSISEAITSYIAYVDAYSLCNQTIQFMVKEYLRRGYFARAMDKLLITGSISKTKHSLNKTAKEPPIKAKGEATNEKSVVLSPHIDTDVNWVKETMLDVTDKKMSREDKLIRIVHNLLRSHTSPMENSQLRATIPIVYSKEYRRLYIHCPPGIIPNVQQLYGLQLFKDSYLINFSEILKGRTSICILSLYLSAYDLIYILRGGVLLKIPKYMHRINIETLTIVYSTKVEILLILYLLIGQPGFVFIINRLTFRYAPNYRQEHLNSILTDTMNSWLEWKQPEEVRKQKRSQNKKAHKDGPIDYVARQLYGRSHITNSPEGASLSKLSNKYRSKCQSNNKLKGVDADNVDSLTENTYTSSIDASSSLNGFLVNSDSENSRGEGKEKQSRHIEIDKDEDDPVVVGFSRKAGSFTSSRLDFLIYKSILSDMEQQMKISINTLHYTELVLRIITGLSLMKLQMRVRLCVLTSFINDDEPLETEQAQIAAEQEYASCVIFLTKILKCLLKADIDTLVFENIALDWSTSLIRIRNELVARIDELRSSLAKGVGIFYIFGSYIRPDKPPSDAS